LAALIRTVPAMAAECTATEQAAIMVHHALTK
jgi:hypothetical protein